MDRKVRRVCGRCGKTFTGWRGGRDRSTPVCRECKPLNLGRSLENAGGLR